MELKAKDVLDVLTGKGITHLYHANTVTTACTFIRAGGLLSRGAIETLGLKQTPQKSDKLDKQFGVWNDIFLDSSDLHKYFGRQNHYGPVLFRFNINILTYDKLPPLWVTRDNPIYWKNGESDNQHYFQGIDEFEQTYESGAYKEMITLRHTTDPLPFENYLEAIILDDPNLTIENINLKDEAVKALREAIKESPVNLDSVSRTIRSCKDDCYCRTNYAGMAIEELSKLFLLQ